MRCKICDYSPTTPTSGYNPGSTINDNEKINLIEEEDGSYICQLCLDSSQVNYNDYDDEEFVMLDLGFDDYD